MARWVEVGPASDFVTQTRQTVRVENRALVIFHIGDEWHAIENSCPHAGLPLDEGELNGSVLTCPYHGYTFNLATGCNVDDPSDAGVKCFAVKVEEEKVWVEVE